MPFKLQSIILCAILRLTLAVIPPSQDPFYRPPPGFASTAPGAILRQRSLLASDIALSTRPVEAYQLLYRTRATNGSAIATVTTVFKPTGIRSDRFVSYQIPQDSAFVDCAPSYNLQLGSVTTNPFVTSEVLVIQAYLSAGYIVSSPDYEGPDAAFAAGRLAGFAVLDSMRAVQEFLGGKTAIVGAGYSGGAIATGWAASLHRTYAPELELRGWTMGGTPANLTGTLSQVDATLFAGLILPALAGLRSESSYATELGPLFQQILTPYGLSQLNIAETNCGLTAVLGFVGHSVLQKSFQSLGSALLQEPVFSSVLNLQLMGANSSETPIAPVLLYHASKDEIIPYANASTLSRTWCENSATVHFTTYARGGHTSTEFVGLIPAIRHTEAFFEQIASQECTSETVLDQAIDVLALGLDVEPVLTELANNLIRLGGKDDNLSISMADIGRAT